MEKLNENHFINQIPKQYPEKFYDFKDGVNIKDEEIKKWIQKCLLRLKEKISKDEKRKDFHLSTSSGNTLITIEAYRQENRSFTIYINVTQDYKRLASIDLIF